MTNNVAMQASHIDKIRRLNAIGTALSSERDSDLLLELILDSARELTHADAGSIYLYDAAGKFLRFSIVQNDSLNIHLGGSEGKLPHNSFPTIPVYLPDGKPNDKTIVAWTVIHNRSLNIADAYEEQGFDFSGTRAFDARTGYRSTSFLSIPMLNHENEIIAVLQLLNKLDDDGKPTQFSHFDQEIAESLASQAAVAMTNQGLILEMRNLFDSFVKTIATAIDKKSAHTGGHCRRVPDVTLWLAEAAAASDLPELKDFTIDDDDRYEITTAAWLHDCGKVTTPSHVMEKATKLDGLNDRIETVVLRFEIVRRDLENAFLKACLQSAQNGEPLPDAAELEQKIAQISDDIEFLRRCNQGGEFMRDEDLARLDQLSAQTWQDHLGLVQPAILPDERDLLAIRRGTLSAAERKIMEDHMVVTIEMLGQLPFPKHLRHVPEYAGGHHERMNGTGYPRGLRREQMSIPARVMAIADVFEALTAPDRPYKKPMTLSQTLNIMSRMVEDEHLDPDLFYVFVTSQVYLKYAKIHLQASQMDEVDCSQLKALSMARLA